MATSISAILIPCLKSFNQLQERVEQPDYHYEREVSSVSWGDELGRIRVWAENIGAHQTGQSSLDFRLRDASHISNQITKLLQDLKRSLDAIVEELSEDGTEASEDEEMSASWVDGKSTTELQQLHEEVVNVIDCLYQLSIIIRKPAQHDLLVGSRMGDEAHFELYDKEHVRNLYPRTEEQISQRLGHAITRRRKYLKYRERHHRKLEKGIEEVQGTQRATTESVLSETIATDFKAQNIDFEETSSCSGMSQTTYASSLIDGGRVTIPPPPRESVGGKPFECPYCFIVVDIKSTRSWSRHIFKDIRPYVCTFADCSMPDSLYDSRREWYFHEITEHHRENYVCALCKNTLKSSKQYGRHVAHHLEELALFALPRIEMDHADDDDDYIVDARASTSGIGVTVDNALFPLPRIEMDHAENNDVYEVDARVSDREMIIAIDKALSRWPRIEMDHTEDDDPCDAYEVVARSSTSEIGVTVDNAHSSDHSDHSDHSSSASVTDDEDSTGTDVQVRARSAVGGHENFDPIEVQNRERNVIYPDETHPSEASNARHRLILPGQNRSPQPRKLIDEVIKNALDRAGFDTVLAKIMNQIKEIVRSCWWKFTGEEASELYIPSDLDIPSKITNMIIQKVIEQMQTGGGLNVPTPVSPPNPSTPASIRRNSDEQRPFLSSEEKPKTEQDEMFSKRVEKIHGVGYVTEDSYIEGLLRTSEKFREHGHRNRNDPEILDLTRPTYLKVHRRHLSLTTLDEYHLPWEWDEVNSALHNRHFKCLDR